jgi:hypothetical protein
MSNKEQFIKIMEQVERPGVDKLLDWLEGTDFYSAPASTRFHGSYPGGLVYHTLNVVYELRELVKFYEVEGIPKESIILVALAHDFCKINTYEETMVNVPPQRSKTAKWEQQLGYKKNEPLKLGHGAKSLSILQDFITLKDYEKEAIFWHMGAYDTGTLSSVHDLYDVFEENKLAFLLHMADMVATYITESEGGEE